MEERVSPASHDSLSPPPRLPPLPPSATPQPTLNINLALQIAPAPGRPLETYVVQVPKDQVYRVPPPENARMVELYRNPVKKHKSRRICILWTLLVLVLIGVILGVSFSAFYHAYTPESPVFSVSHVSVKSSNASPTSYDITLKIRNPNDRMGIDYGSDASVMLIYSKRTIATGQFQGMRQEIGNSTAVPLILGGSKGALPADVETSLKDKKPTHAITLALKLKAPLVMNVWIFKMWNRKMVVTCDFRVSTLGQGTQVVSQNCVSQLS